MHKLISFFVKNRVWTNVIMFSVFIFGLIILSNMRSSFFPEVEPDVLTVAVVYPGASPEEVEEGVILKIEEKIDGINDIERVTSVSRENMGIVTVQIVRNGNLDKVLADVKNAVDGINSFPVGIEPPIIADQKFRTRALSIVISGDADLYNLKFIADRFREELISTEEISQVDIEGVPDLEFAIEISEGNLRRYGLSFTEITQKIAASNINISGGKFDTNAEEILIRAYGKRYFGKELGNIVLRGNPDGTVIFLRDVATIKEQFADDPDRILFNGKIAAIINIDQAEQENILKIVEKCESLVDKLNGQNKGIKATIIDNRTIPLMQRLDLLTRNGIAGLLLVVITLGFFLNLRLSFWVSMGIPFSFAAMFIVAGLIGVTVNVISLFGMIIVVGILVDDAIVVGENIYAHYERGKPAMKAAIDGTVEMLVPVFTSIATTILAFTPFYFLDGRMGNFMVEMATVVTLALLFSLLEAFLILPPHLAHSRGLHPHEADSRSRMKIERMINYLTNNIYAPALRFVLEHKWLTISTPVALFLITAGLIGGGFIGVTFFPYIDSDRIPVNISLVPGQQEAKTDSILQYIESKAMLVNEELSEQRKDGKKYFESIRRETGKNDYSEMGSHVGRLTIELLNGEERGMDSYIIANKIREKVGELVGVENISYGLNSMFGKPISVSLLGNDIKQLNRARDLLLAEMNNFSSLRDITDSNQEGARELKIELKPKAYSLGLTLRDIAGQVRQAFFGSEVQRIQRGIDEIRVWVRYLPQDRSSLGMLDRMLIRTPMGEYPFSELAVYSIERGITTINHLDRKREIRVEANLADEKLDVPPIVAELKDRVLPEILSKVDGVHASFEGQSREQKKFQTSMQKAFPLALIMMFILVILVFRSYLQAVVIFSLIPLGLLGAIWGHGFHGIQLNALSIYGIIALSGIIINDAIVYMDQTNRNLKKGMKIYDAIYDAGLSRLRPILLTSLTTALGLGPLIFETSRQAQFLIPMAISVAYGLMFGTVILLLILPAMILVVNKLRYLWSTYILREEVTYEDVEPAIIEYKRDLEEAV